MVRILLIEDDKDIRQTIGHQLSSAGHQVVTAADGAEGLRHLRAERPDLVITDIVMPGKEGIETIMEIRETGTAIPIIAISGGGGPIFQIDKDLILDNAKMLGADYILAKPFRSCALLELVDRALSEKGQAPRQIRDQ